MKVYHSFQFRDLFSVEMGNSLEQYRASIGLNNSGPRSRRKQPDVFWMALGDLFKIVLVLQVLLAGLVVLQLHLYDQPWQPSPGFDEGGASVFIPLVGKVITDLKWLTICNVENVFLVSSYLKTMGVKRPGLEKHIAQCI